MKTSSLIDPEKSEQPGRREELEREADVARTKLVITLTELERRGQVITDTGRMVARHRKPIVLAMVSVTAVALVFTAFAMKKRARRRRPLNRQRLEALRRLWNHPERIAPGRPSLFADAGRRLLTSAAEVAGAKALERLLGGVPSRVSYSSFAERPTEPKL